MTLVPGLTRRASRLVEIQAAIVVLSVFIVAAASAMNYNAMQTRLLHAGFEPLVNVQNAGPVVASTD